MNNHEALKQLPDQVQAILRQTDKRDECLQQVAQLLSEQIEVYDWVGFYIAAADGRPELHLGPYVGNPTDHTVIPFGKGICGQVAESHKTFVVDDVDAEDNYLSCNIHVKSEIVVPIMDGDRFLAQLDIDSNTKAAMDKTHQQILENICHQLRPLFL